MSQRRTSTSLTLSTAALALAAALSGCGADASTGAPAAEPAASHTMSDGSVMAGAEHGDHEADHEGDHEATAGGPSETALMVCGGSVAADVERLLGLEAPPESSYSWAEPVFSCTYETGSGPLVLTVHDTADEADGERWFEATRTRLAPTEELKGVYGLGLPAFETGRGQAAFIREGKTLVVDATGMPRTTGPQGDMDRADLAYAVATSVLACWTDHA